MAVGKELPFNKLSVDSKVSLITAAKFRYEGTVAGIDSVEGTLILQKVTYWGGEDRLSASTTARGPAVGSVFDSITFWMSNIIELTCEEADGINDRAVVKASTNAPPNQAGDNPPSASSSGQTPTRQRSRRQKFSKKSDSSGENQGQPQVKTPVRQTPATRQQRGQTSVSETNTTTRQVGVSANGGGGGGGGRNNGRRSGAGARFATTTTSGMPTTAAAPLGMLQPQIYPPQFMAGIEAGGVNSRRNDVHAAAASYYQQQPMNGGLLLGPTLNGLGSPPVMTTGGRRNNGRGFQPFGQKRLSDSEVIRRRYNTNNGGNHHFAAPHYANGSVAGATSTVGSGATPATGGVLVCLPPEMAAAAVNACQQQMPPLHFQQQYFQHQQQMHQPRQYQHQQMHQKQQRWPGGSGAGGGFGGDNGCATGGRLFTPQARRRGSGQQVGGQGGSANGGRGRRRGMRRNYRRQSGNSEPGVDCLTPYDFESANAQMEAELAKLTLSDDESLSLGSADEAISGATVNATTASGGDGDAASSTTTRPIINTDTSVPAANGASGDSSSGAVTSTGVTVEDAGTNRATTEAGANTLHCSLSKGEYYDREKSFFDRISRIETHGDRTIAARPGAATGGSSVAVGAADKRSRATTTKTKKRASSTTSAHLNTSSGNGSATVGSTTDGQGVSTADNTDTTASSGPAASTSGPAPPRKASRRRSRATNSRNGGASSSAGMPVGNGMAPGGSYLASARRERKLNMETFGSLAARPLSFGPRFRYGHNYGRRTMPHGGASGDYASRGANSAVGDALHAPTASHHAVATA